MIFHLEQLLAFAFQHPVNGNTGPARHDLCDVTCGDGFFKHGTACTFALLDCLQLLLKLRHTTIGQLARALIFAATLRIGQFLARLFKLALDLLSVGQFVSLSLPAGGQRIAFFLKLGQFFLQPLQPILRCGIGFLFQRLLLDLAPHDFAVDVVEFFRLGIDRHFQPRTCFVDQIDGFIGKKTVGDVAM